jgi:hypothetical protein
MIFSSIHFPPNEITSFFLIAVIPLHAYASHFLYSLVDGHLGKFHSLDIENNVALKKHETASVSLVC